MSKAIDITGKRFGKLTVVENAGRDPKLRGAIWRCVCDCGKERVAYGIALRRGQIYSCGCSRKPNKIPKHIKSAPIRKRKSEKGKPCPYNEGCACEKMECQKCGWNPEVAKARMEAKYGN